MDKNPQSFFSKGEFDRSMLRLWCIGTVAVDKPENSDIVEVFPAERLSQEEGDPAEVVDITVTVPDAEGNSKTVTTQRHAKLKARWFPNGLDGRQTAPDVVTGEHIQLHRYADSQTIFWTTMYREPALRRLEHVTYAYSNLREGREQFEKSSSYGMTFSTRDKGIELWTSKSDGESYQYRQMIDTRQSTVHLTDDALNAFEFESERNDVRIRNGDGAYVRCVGDTVHIRAESIVLHAPVYIDQNLYVSGIVHAYGYTLPGIPGPDDGNLPLGKPRELGGDGSWGDDTDEWHDRTHVYANNRRRWASIGDRWESYSHYQYGNMEHAAITSISETTPTKVTNNDTDTTTSAVSSTLTTPDRTENTERTVLNASEKVVTNTPDVENNTERTVTNATESNVLNTPLDVSNTTQSQINASDAVFVTTPLATFSEDVDIERDLEVKRDGYFREHVWVGDEGAEIDLAAQAGGAAAAADEAKAAIELMKTALEVSESVVIGDPSTMGNWQSEAWTDFLFHRDIAIDRDVSVGRDLEVVGSVKAPDATINNESVVAVFQDLRSRLDNLEARVLAIETFLGM